MAEKKLEQLIDSLQVVSGINDMDEVNPIVHRLSNNTIRKVTAIVCAHREPVNLILPLNVVWFVYDPLSVFYKMALRRVSKEADVNRGTAHTWELIDTMAQLNADQAYDEDDAAILNAEDPIPLASESVLGIARLSVPAANAADPVAVGEGDPRLTDARPPLEHSHAQQPATALKTKTGVVTISGSVAPVAGATLVATSPTSAVWRQLTTNDVQR